MSLSAVAIRLRARAKIHGDQRIVESDLVDSVARVSVLHQGWGGLSSPVRFRETRVPRQAARPKRPNHEIGKIAPHGLVLLGRDPRCRGGIRKQQRRATTETCGRTDRKSVV